MGAPAPQSTYSLPPAPLTSRIGPSFDCSQARDALAGLVCGSDALSLTDMRFAQAYQAIRQQVGDAGQSAVRREAIDFQAQVYAECKLPRQGFVPPQGRALAEACVTQAYQRQRNLWASRLSQAGAEEVSRPLPQHMQLQAALQKFGYIQPTSTIDGVYGLATRSAITSWQVTNNWPALGI
jgi:hypothetical protein